MATSQDNTEDDAYESTATKVRRKSTSFHCCVPRCNGDSRSNSDLIFHRIPGRPGEDSIRKKWLVKIRRDEGPNFKISTATRVCSRHFIDEDYLAPDKAGRRLLKRGAIPSKFDWSAEPKVRRKIIRHIDRDTQTDESESESEINTPNMDTLKEEIEALRAELLANKKQLAESQSETASAIREVQVMKDQAKAIKAQADKEIDDLKRQAAEQLALLKFGLERELS